MRAIFIISGIFIFVLAVSAEYAVVKTDDGSSFCVGYDGATKTLPQNEENAVVLKLIALNATNGCAISTNAPFDVDFIGITTRGECTFGEKAKFAEKSGSGAKSLVVISNDTDLFAPFINATELAAAPIAVVLIDQPHGQLLLNKSFARIFAPVAPRFDASAILFAVIAVTLIVLGSFWSAYADVIERFNGPLDANQSQPTQPSEEGEQPFLVMSVKMVVGYIIGACAMLTLMYFFYQYMVYVLIGIYCISALSSLVICSNFVLNYFGVRYGPMFTIPKIGVISVRKILEIAFALAIVIFYIVARHERYIWILQDVVGAAMVVTILRSLRLPNIKISALLLILFFLYDIFFVFITPLFTSDHESVMVKAATGGKSAPTEVAPLAFILPHIIDPYHGACGGGGMSLLGFGDVVLPGLLVSFTLSFDVEMGTWKNKLYFLTSITAYFLGLCATFVALLLMNSAQPALLYLVPFTLGSVAALGWYRGELRLLWSGPSYDRVGDVEILEGINSSPFDEVDVNLDNSEDDSL